LKPCVSGPFYLLARLPILRSASLCGFKDKTTFFGWHFIFEAPKAISKMLVMAKRRYFGAR
jgi:hypothetical protein